MRFSVVIPTRDRPAQAARCLRALAEGSTPPSRFEVILVDDGSRVPYAEPIELFRKLLNLIYLRQDNQGPSAARNAGARVARGDHIVFTDDDCLPSPGWLEHLSRAATAAPESLLGGRRINGRPENPYCRVCQFLDDAVYYEYETKPEKVFFFTSNNIALPRKSFEAVGGFSLAMRISSEDREFCDRWRRRGGLLTYVPDAVVYHAPEMDGPRYVRRYFEYGRGAYHYHRAPARRPAGPVAQTMGHFRRVFATLAGLGKGLNARERLGSVILLSVWPPATLGGFLWEMCLTCLRRSFPRGLRSAFVWRP